MNHKDFAINLAKQAGANIRAGFGVGMEKQWKPDHSPVTETDLKNNQLVIDSVRAQYPMHSILSEEGSFMLPNAEYVWVCDPIDGTIPFSHGVPTCVFSLALVKNGEPILGVIYDPFMERMFFAEKGKGAFLNGNPIHVSDSNFDKSLMCWDVKTLSKLKLLHPHTHFMTLYSICYEGILVACGEFVATYYDYSYAHDIAALKVIVEEAGGKVTDKNGNEQRYDRAINGALISNGVVHQQLIDFIKSGI